MAGDVVEAVKKALAGAVPDVISLEPVHLDRAAREMIKAYEAFEWEALKAAEASWLEEFKAVLARRR